MERVYYYRFSVVNEVNGKKVEKCIYLKCSFDKKALKLHSDLDFKTDNIYAFRKLREKPLDTCYLEVIDFDKGKIKSCYATWTWKR